MLGDKVKKLFNWMSEKNWVDYVHIMRLEAQIDLDELIEKANRADDLDFRLKVVNNANNKNIEKNIELKKRIKELEQENKDYKQGIATLNRKIMCMNETKTEARYEVLK